MTVIWVPATDKAKKMRRLIIKIGINKNNKGGGDNIGNTTSSSRRERAKRIMTIIDLNINSSLQDNTQKYASSEKP